MIAEIKNFRSKYPEYNDMDDATLASALAKKYPEYADLPAKVAAETAPVVEEEAQKQEETKAPWYTPAVDTLRNISKVVPALETGAQLATSAYGVPISGLMGLSELVLSGSLSEADKMRQQVQNALVYQPRTASGQDLSASLAYPFEKYEQGVAKVAETVDAEGQNPNLAALVHTAGSFAPNLLGARGVLKAATPKSITQLSKNTAKAVKEGIHAAVKPSVKSRKTKSQVTKADADARMAVEDIVQNKAANVFEDEGFKRSGTPKSLEDFQEAIDQGKTRIFSEYDELAKQTDAASLARPAKYPVKLKEGERLVVKEGKPHIVDDNAFKVTTNSAIKELESLKKSDTIKRASSKTVDYIDKRINDYKNAKFTATDAQDTIRMLNESTKAYQSSPNIDTMGAAMVDTLILNHLRKGLSDKVKQATGADYAQLKKKYGAYKSLEEDVARAVNRERNSAIGKKTPNFSDVVSAHQIITGLGKADPVKIAGGAVIEGVSLLRKRLRDPNKQIEKMFKTVDENLQRTSALQQQRLNKQLNLKP